MPSQRNINDLEYLKDRMNNAKAIVFADYKGLTVAQVSQLRRQIKALGAEMKVIKNTLLRLALKDTNHSLEEIDKELNGPTAAVFNLEDEISPIKALADFSQNNGLPKFKAGFLGTVFLSADEVEKLAQLPDKDILLAKVVAGLNAPLYGLTSVLQGNLRKLVFVLKAIKDKKN